MSVWATYSLSDFLLFSPETYFRLFARYNHTVWPAQLSAFAAGLALLGLAWSRDPRFPRLALGALALAWAWTGWAFHLQRYAAINWAALWFAAIFFTQAAVLALAAARPARGATPATPRVRRVGAALTLVALFYPALALLAGRPLATSAAAGFAPDPTVLATLGLVLMAELGARQTVLALILPLLWCAIGGATLWALASPEAVLLPAAGLLSLVLATRTRRRAA